MLVTMRLLAGLPSLRCDTEHALVRAALAASSGTSFQVVEYSVQSNHLHLLVEAKGRRELSRGMNALAVRLVRRLQSLWKRIGRVFADRYHARALTTPRAVRNALTYLLQNARKHGAWRARHPDVYSSGSSFDGWKGGAVPAPPIPGVTRDADSSPPWIRRTRTWLLSVGWRRHGLIDPRELPVGSLGA